MQASLIEQELEPADAPAPGPSCAEPAGEFGPRWTPVDFVGGSPGSRVFPSAVVSGACVYIFGGHNGTTYRNDLLVLSLETRSWTVDSEVDGDGRPTPRDAHAAVLLGGRLYVFGGYDSKRYLADFHSYGLDSGEWRVEAASGSPPSPRGGHAAVVHGSRLIVFGGCDGWNYFNDTLAFDVQSAEWAPVRVAGTAPGARSAPSTAVHEATNALYVFGGYDGARSLNDLFRMDLRTSEWAPVRTSGVPPSPRGGHTAVVHGDRIYTFGGKSGRSPFNDLCCLDLTSGVWEAVRAGSPAPAPRCAHVSVVHGGSLLIFGGYDGRHYFSDCFEWSLEADRGAASQALAGDLECMVESGQFSDIWFEVEGKTVPAHKFLLFARCEYFRRMFTSGYAEAAAQTVRIEGVSHAAFKQVLHYLYSGRPREMNAEAALEVLAAANLYGVEPLKRAAAEIIGRSLTPENAAAVLSAADSYQAPALRAQATAFIVRHFAAVVQTDAFAELVSERSRPLLLALLREVGTVVSPAGLAASDGLLGVAGGLPAGGYARRRPDARSPADAVRQLDELGIRGIADAE
ncbi:hypothetical protein EMIHUDRAFT_458743 [Emiliania huxleyi CCMP1516]|uniref:BTB domain-containing protein n=2 Tax=Emiliania huxleyi TaxID=2903 RepID=A0A0D3J729_EMIH1|nr:hypothetical protein EMIHUDRAFT_458743 [Emiliania huxleyi CCMP1516]EOD19314.1 hypothetical protein EMIHUDRAFT_458743 [Emiliania huxleyi CCMP1516]|eukprot:XP_005771743.1 hypothetical protein EMIHUDRAFT_458743 [Emiliania huxleyi CCMP1516]